MAENRQCSQKCLELVATWRNLGQRPRVLEFMLSFAYKRFAGVVPEPGNPSRSSAKGLDSEDRALTYHHTGAIGTWAKSELPAGQALRKPALLFKKLDESVVEDEYARLEG
jgi:hypothetical protein